MASRPPSPNRTINGDVSVDLADFLLRLNRALGRSDGFPFGRPGSYCELDFGCENPADFAVTYLFNQIMSKFDDESKATDLEKTERSLRKFSEAEDACAESNAWFFNHAMLGNELGCPRDCDPDVWSAMLHARRKIKGWLGPFDWNEAAAGFQFTYGASARMPRTRSAPAHKYSSKLEITSGVEPLARAALQYNPAWGSRLGDEPFKILEGNRVLCVPKNYKVHRTIAAEPSGCMYFQKGIGTALKRRLRAVGVDLRSQTQNQDWSYFGSKTGLVATIDLSMASDTVSKGIVEWAIPPDWVEAMAYCRSPFGVLSSGDKVLYRKWSSMGNAYTFELETMLFYGLVHGACAVTGSDTRFTGVYGDDIVTPVGSVDLLLRVLRRCGFVPNEEKSFVSGPFRESCGKHYFAGVDVTPFYIRRQPRKLTDLFLLVNNLERWVRRVEDALPEHLTSSVRGVIKHYRSLAPNQWRRPRIPDGFGDGAFIGTFDECLPTKPRGKWLWWEGWQVEVISEVPRRISGCSAGEHINEYGVLRAMLADAPLEETPYDSWLAKVLDLCDTRSAVLPNRSKRYHRTTMIVPQF